MNTGKLEHFLAGCESSWNYMEYANLFDDDNSKQIFLLSIAVSAYSNCWLYAQQFHQVDQICRQKEITEVNNIDIWLKYTVPSEILSMLSASFAHFARYIRAAMSSHKFTKPCLQQQQQQNWASKCKVKFG